MDGHKESAVAPARRRVLGVLFDVTIREGATGRNNRHVGVTDLRHTDGRVEMRVTMDDGSERIVTNTMSGCLAPISFPAGACRVMDEINALNFNVFHIWMSHPFVPIEEGFDLGEKFPSHWRVAVLKSQHARFMVSQGYHLPRFDSAKTIFEEAHAFESGVNISAKAWQDASLNARRVLVCAEAVEGEPVSQLDNDVRLHVLAPPAKPKKPIIRNRG